MKDGKTYFRTRGRFQSPRGAHGSSAAHLGSQACLAKSTVHSALCTINGDPQKLVNLSCTATAQRHVADLMQYVNDTLLPQLEQELGIQFEFRNLHFAVAGLATSVPAAEHALGVLGPDDWLENPFAEPASQPVPLAGGAAPEVPPMPSMV